MPRGKDCQNLNSRSRHRYAELSRLIAAFRRRLSREGALPPKLGARFVALQAEAAKLRSTATNY